jgi:uncharacterized protein YodC (DUF2158 family)
MNEESTPKTEKPALKVGDVVILNSGGPNMTISHIFDYAVPNAVCRWIADGKEQRAEFPLPCLTKATWGTPVLSLSVPIGPSIQSHQAPL